MLAILVALTTAVGIFGSLPYLWAAYVNVLLFVVLRPLYYSGMSDYAVKTFGYAKFGRVYGLIIFLSGLINLSQPAIDAAEHEIFHDNPIPINVILASLGLVIGTALVSFVYSQGRRFEAQEKKMSETTRLLPEIEEEV